MRHDPNDGGNGGGGQTRKPPLLPLVKASEFAYGEPPPLEYVDGHGLFLQNDVNYLTGAGAVGKSLLMLQLACAVALSPRDYPESFWLGRPVNLRGPVLYLTTEDDQDECWRRIRDIAASEIFEIRRLYRLQIADLVMHDKVLFQGRNAVKKTPLFDTLQNTVDAITPVLVIIDNRAQTAEVQELDRSAATKIGGYLRRLAKGWGTTVILLAHPSLSGMRDKTGNSGSTGWLNSIRNQIDMCRPDDTEGPDDDGRRQLVNRKSNYGPLGRVVNLKWELGCYRCTDKPKRAGADIGQADRAERVFLALLSLHTGRGINVSANPKAQNYGPRVFGGHPKREGTTPKMLAAAMEALFDKGKIRAVRYGAPSDDTWRLEVVNCNF
ncbi:AAA family ATPase [Sinorhizobium mexicanum]|uniref:AAA family ATPase n=1 Tax=Sinorhizobium mexicanum TaxID=375549 RepID=A0A859QGV0_9HYPH|nr:AAA family ATPase [Sinorhizobium mexicanum]MBP1881951.1 RecA-family ATPase [Sinorhizobium mexicanum]QLL61685.1 AAA family ATPase [Sinorhizobium mexicanum]